MARKLAIMICVAAGAVIVVLLGEMGIDHAVTTQNQQLGDEAAQVTSAAIDVSR